MSITFGRITSQTDLMINRFHSHYGITIDQVAIKEASKLTKTVTASVHKSIFKPVTTMKKPGATVAFESISSGEGLLTTGSSCLKDYTISYMLLKLIDWKKQPCSTVKVYHNVQVDNLADLPNPLKMGMLQFLPQTGAHRIDMTFDSTMLMRCALCPFAEGEVCLTYHGQLAKEERDLLKEGHSMVMKSFKHLGKGVNARNHYLKQMKVSNKYHHQSPRTALESRCC